MPRLFISTLVTAEDTTFPHKLHTLIYEELESGEMKYLFQDHLLVTSRSHTGTQAAVVRNTVISSLANSLPITQ